MTIEDLIRKRLVRLLLAACLLATAGWAFLPYLTNRVAASAFVNSELTRVTAPFAGHVSRSMPHKGDLIDNATDVNLIEALSPDRRHLLDLELQYTLAKENAALARRQLQEIATLDLDLAQRFDAYRLAVAARLKHEALEADAERSGCLEELKHRNEIGLRLSTLTESGLAAPIRSAEAHALQDAASTRCAMAAAKLDRINAELDAAERGVFVREGIGDAPYAQQQRDNLVLRRQELEARAQQEAARSTQLAADIEAERDRIALLGSYRAALPAGHVVWSTGASPGSAVTEGQTILDLADCAHRFVVVELPERDFEQIKTGDTAAVRLVGSTEWRDGVVQQIRGSAARTDDRLFAAQTPSPGPATITVEVAIPPEAAHAGDNGSFCGIGRLAEVRFPRPLFDFRHLVQQSGHRPTASTPAPREHHAAVGG